MRKFGFAVLPAHSRSGGTAVVCSTLAGADRLIRIRGGMSRASVATAQAGQETGDFEFDNPICWPHDWVTFEGSCAELRLKFGIEIDEDQIVALSDSTIDYCEKEGHDAWDVSELELPNIPLECVFRNYHELNA